MSERYSEAMAAACLLMLRRRGGERRSEGRNASAVKCGGGVDSERMGIVSSVIALEPLYCAHTERRFMPIFRGLRPFSHSFVRKLCFVYLNRARLLKIPCFMPLGWSQAVRNMSPPRHQRRDATMPQDQIRKCSTRSLIT